MDPNHPMFISKDEAAIFECMHISEAQSSEDESSTSIMSWRSDKLTQHCHNADRRHLLRIAHRQQPDVHPVSADRISRRTNGLLGDKLFAAREVDPMVMDRLVDFNKLVLDIHTNHGHQNWTAEGATQRETERKSKVAKEKRSKKVGGTKDS